jgi:hypothetical protein
VEDRGTLFCTGLGKAIARNVHKSDSSHKDGMRQNQNTVDLLKLENCSCADVGGEREQDMSPVSKNLPKMGISEAKRRRNLQMIDCSHTYALPSAISFEKKLLKFSFLAYYSPEIETSFRQKRLLKSYL